MPGIRALADIFKVAPATIVKAVDRVRKDGWISNTTARQRFTIHRDVILDHKGKDAMLRTLLLLAPKSDQNETSTSTAQALVYLWEILAPKGWNIRFHLDDYASGKCRKQVWDEILELEKPQAVVAILGTPAMATWARNAAIPTFFCGGSVGDTRVPITAVSSTKMIDEAMDRLLALGHKNISVMLAKRSPEFCKKIKAKVRQKLSDSRIDYSEMRHTPTSAAATLESFRDSVKETFEQHPVTAMICFDWSEYLAAFCCVQAMGLKVPRDVSMLCLSSDHASSWFSPAPTRCRHPMKELVKTLAGWIEDISTHTQYDITTFHSVVWEDGETISNPP